MQVISNSRKWIAKILALALVLGAVFAAPVPANAAGTGGAGLPDYTSEWDSFRGASAGLTSGKTPRAASEAFLKWTKTYPLSATWNSVSSPVIVNNNVYFAVNDYLYRYDKTGKQTGSIRLSEKIGYASFLAYGGGLIYVPLFGGAIQAFRADTLESCWIAPYPRPEGDTFTGTYRAESTVFYHDGYIYTGVYGYKNLSNTYGSFFAIDVTDEDPQSGTETKDYAWRYEVGAGSLKGYYWAGATLAKDHILFAGDDGTLVSVPEKPISGAAITDSVKVNKAPDGFVRSGVLYNDGIVYTAAKDGTVWAIPLKADGTFDRANAKSATVSNESAAATPVIALGKLYVLSGYINGGGMLDVFDAKTLKKLKTLNLGGYAQSSPLIQTSYATAANGSKVYLYIAMNEKKDDIIVIEDSDKLKTPLASVLYSPGGSYSLNSLIAGSDGTIYFADGKGRLNSLGSKYLTYDPTTDVHDVKFNAKGGSVKESARTLINGKTYGKLPVPKRTGYTFKGWYADKKYKKVVTANTKVNLSADTVVYAKWLAKTYKIKYKLCGGKALKKKSKSVKYNAHFGKLPAPKRTGYKFTGWYTKANGGKKITAKSTVKKGMNLYAHWKKK
jgi:uncharacterized repeat protein (TIGR02543 family)